MSFGFSVGDFLAAIQLANKIRKDFADAPSQFKAISDEVRTLSIVLQDADVAFPDRELDNDHKRDLEDIDKGCRNVLGELQRILDNNSELSSEIGSVGKRIRRVWKRLKWKPEDIDELRNRISTNIRFLNVFNGQLTRDNVVKLVRHQENQEHAAILNWLTPIDFVSQQNDFIARRQGGTGTWLLDSTEYQSWRAIKNQTLFCPGIPGAGKTVLTSVVVNELTTWFANDPTIGIAYIYCDFRRQDEQTINDLLASLLKQLAGGQPSLPETIKELYGRHKRNRTRPSLDEISATLQAVATLYSRVFIIIDALDECQASHGCRERLLSEIFDLQTKTRANLFTTSRLIPEITERFINGLRLDIRASNQDVQRYLDGHMSQLPGCVLRNLDIQDEIKTNIMKAVDGMFLLAQLHLDSLKGKKSPKAIRTALKKLPTGSEAYDYAYKDAMERIEGQLADEEDLAKQALSWIICAKRPLTTSELEHALAVEIDESQLDIENICRVEDIVSICAGLVTVDEESKIIRLVHYTTQEYFERTQRQWFPNAQANITTICVSYLSFDEFKSGICQDDDKLEQRLQSYKLYHYAAHNWGRHAQEASTLCPGVLDFLQKQAQVVASSQVLIVHKRWLDDTGYSQRFPKQITGLHLAAYLGVDNIVRALLSSNSPNLKDSNGQTPLFFAAQNGHEAVVKLLLAKKVDIDVDVKDKDSRTPLSFAARYGHEAVVKLLLAEKVDVNVKDSISQTPLMFAALNGHEAVVKLLLAEKVDVDAKESYSQTALMFAARNGQKAVVKLLLAEKVDVDAKDTHGQTPLLFAAENGHEAVVKLLLAEKVDVDAKDKHGQTPLLFAAENGHEAVVKLLLAEKVDVNAKDSSDQTPLMYASMNGHKAIVKLLLQKQADGRPAALTALE